jgi:ATP-dependent helicase HepA
MATYMPGQRWISETEPELGLGTILSLDNRMVRVIFPASEQERCYASDQAPLHRVAFKTGDRIVDQQGGELTVDEAREEKGLLIYRCGKRVLPETELSDLIGFSKPDDRLRHGKCDENRFFILRRQAQALRHALRGDATCGFAGARIDLLSHQLYIAGAATAVPSPRVLLADEVGLGKTIEAGLILHRLVVTGRVKRILVLLPETLVHQWFVEMLRRFNMKFNIFDEDRCLSVEDSAAGHNPFDTEQFVMTSLDYLVQNPERADQAALAGWDVLVVDEAHHLRWSPEAAGDDYKLVERLSRLTPSVLLLTATPEQLGVESHFARLRLLDPERYAHLDGFLKEATAYRSVAAIARKLMDNRKLTAADRKLLHKTAGKDSETMMAWLNAVEATGDAEARETILRELIDLHGVGRVIFRNTRSAVPGFPRRKACLHLLPCDDAAVLQDAAAEFRSDATPGTAEPAYRLDRDPRLHWLAKFLKKTDEKVLVICRTKARAQAVEAALRTRVGCPMGLFHEDLNLVQRDRNAAWFAEADGAQVLICSEIGSEGRNFQFSCNLVLFDLPMSPEILEQRIGRLARLGQTEIVQVHVPATLGSPQAMVASWYHLGLNAIEECLEGGWQVAAKFGPELRRLALGTPTPAETETFLNSSREFACGLRKQLEEGRDRLLEMNSHRPDVVAKVIEAIRTQDKDPLVEEFMLRAYECFGVHVEGVSKNTFALQPQDLYADAFPMLPHEGCHVTFDRQKALPHEDWVFVTREHPMCIGAVDWLLGSEKGNSACAHWNSPESMAIYLEAVFLVQAVAPAQWHIDRFLSPTPLRFILDHALVENSASLTPEFLDGVLKDESPGWLLGKPKIAHELLPKQLEAARKLAAAQVPAVVAAAKKKIEEQMAYEIQRAEALCAKGTAKPAEVEALRKIRQGLLEAVAKPTLLLDAVRIIWRGRRPV